MRCKSHTFTHSESAYIICIMCIKHVDIHHVNVQRSIPCHLIYVYVYAYLQYMYMNLYMYIHVSINVSAYLYVKNMYIYICPGILSSFSYAHIFTNMYI